MLAVGRFGAAYYIAGYVIECALKACIARKTNEYDFPPRDAQKFYSHDLEDLSVRAGLDTELKALGVKWTIVKDWSEESRYETAPESKARDLITAIGGLDGVFECIRRSW